MSFVLGAKPGVERWETKDTDGAEHIFRCSNGAPLNDAHAGLEVNFHEYRERRPNGGTRHFSWVTDLRIDRWNVLPAGLGHVLPRPDLRPRGPVPVPFDTS